MNRLLLVFLVLLFACQQSIPEGVVSRATMTQLLMEIHIAEAKVGQLNFRSLDSSRAVQAALEAEIFKKYGIDSVAYNRSYAYYMQQPALLQSIYDSLTVRLDTLTKYPDTWNPQDIPAFK
jgi:hypothetical protein